MPFAVPFAIADWIRSVLNTGGYFALGGLTLLENLFPPIPSEVVLPVAGFYVGRDVLAFVPALLVATLGSVVGALILYAVGRFGGRLAGERFKPGYEWFDRHGGKVVFFGRVVPGVRSLVSVPAGAARMPLLRFVLLTTAGSAIWNGALIGAGWVLGSNWDAVGDYVGPAGRVVLALAVVSGAAALAVRWKRRREARAAC